MEKRNCKCMDKGLPFGSTGNICGDPDCDFTKESEAALSRMRDYLVKHGLDGWPRTEGETSFNLPDLRDRH